MPKQKKATTGNKRALAYAVHNKYRAFPVLQVSKVIDGNTIDMVLDLGFTLFKKENQFFNKSLKIRYKKLDFTFN